MRPMSRRIGHLFGPRDLILHDELIHNSALQGMPALRARRRCRSPITTGLPSIRFCGEQRHRFERVLIVIEGHLQHGRGLPRAAAVHRDQTPPQGVPDGRRSPFIRRHGSDRARHPRTFWTCRRRGRYLDGHAQQDLAGCGGYITGRDRVGRAPEVSGTGIPLQCRHVAAGRRRLSGGARVLRQRAAARRTAA